LEYLGLHSKPKAEVHPGNKMTDQEEEEEEEEPEQEKQEQEQSNITHCSSFRVAGGDHFNRYKIFSINFSCAACERIVWAKELLIIHTYITISNF
jgi:hypothetical protein